MIRARRTSLPVRRSAALVAVALASALAGCTAAPAGGAPPPRTTSPTSPSGERMPVGDRPHWVQTLAEDFDRDAALGSFGAAYPGYDGYDGGRDTSRNFGRPLAEQGLWNDATTSTVAGGVYDCRLHTQGGTPQVCALTPSPDGRWRTGARYGRYSVRFRIDPVPGYKIAWLLWPANGRWRDGEIDFPEAALDGSVTGAAHDVEGRPEHDQWYVDLHTPLTGWHTATITWVPGRITFDLDGRSVSTADPAALPRVPMRWALQAETRLAATPPDPAASGHIRIDWLVAYRYRP